MKLPRNEYRISITSSCNMKCNYCHNEGNRYNIILEKDAIEELIKNSYDLELESVRLTGGEPTIHFQFFDICQMLKEKYNLKVGINTNGILKEKIFYVIEKGWIDKVTVGIDFIDGIISKQSPIGKSSKEILETTKEIKEKGCLVNLATVYMNDLNNTKEIVRWGIENGIRVKIIEETKNEIYPETSISYQNMCQTIIDEFHLIKQKDKFNQLMGVKSNGEISVSFFHSHCRLRECDICKNISLRVTAKAKLKQCLYYDEDDIIYLQGNIHENIIRMLEKNPNYYKDENNHPLERKKVL